MATEHQALTREKAESDHRADTAGSVVPAPQGDAPAHGLLALQRLAGNRAVASMLAGVAQREAVPAAAPSSPKPSPKPSVKASPKAKGSKRASSFSSYADLLNGFQDLAAAAINRGGAGLDTARFGPDLSPAHRALIFQVQAVLIDAQKTDKAKRADAAAAWPALAAKLQAAVAEATRMRLSGEVLAAVTDDIAMLNTKYHARQGKADPELETFEDYADTIKGMEDLFWVFSRMGESSEGIQRENVSQRKDATASSGIQEINAHQRAALTKVELGGRLNARHAKMMGQLRSALILARTENPGSAYGALARFRSIQGELQHVLKRAPIYIGADVSSVKTAMDETAAVLARHYAMVHQQTVQVALTKERTPEEVKAERAVSHAAGPEVAKAMAEAHALEDFGHAMTIIEQHLTPSPDHPGEWILTSGGTVIRVRGDQVEAMRATAAAALKRYMADITKVMVQAWQTYESIKGNSSFKLHVLGGWGGATDPGSQDDVKDSVIHMRDTVVYPMVDEGKYGAAFKVIMGQKGVVERHAGEVGDYDSDLDTGYSRLATSMKVVQVALVALVPVAGEAAMAGSVVGGVAVEGASAWAVGGTAIAAGAGGAGLAETGREVVSGEGLDPSKIGRATYSGAVIGAGAVAPAASRNLGNFLAAGSEGTALVGANALASGTVGAIHSELGGGDAIQGFAGGALGSLAGNATKGLGPAAQAPVAGMALHGAIGAGTAALTGGDPLAGFVGGIAGSLGGSTVAKPSGGSGTPPSAPAGDEAGQTIPGVGIAPRLPAAPAAPVADETLLGVGIAPRPPAPAGGNADQTIPGVGIAPRPPSAPAASETLPGIGTPARPPGGPVEDQVVPSGGPQSANPARSGDTQDSIAPVPRQGNQPSGRSRFAIAPEYAGRPPVMGRVAYVIDNAEEASALYVRLNGEGQRNILGSGDADLELQNWRGDGGQGDPPMAWVRAGDGVVQFSFSRFQRPNLGGYSTEPLGPIPFAGRQPWRQPGTPAPASPAPSGQGPIRAFARLPEFAASPPLYGPTSKVTHVVTDLQEAQQIWTRLVGERQIRMLEHDEDFSKVHWSDDGGVGEVPIAWVRSGDGVIRFNLAKFTPPAPPQGPPS